MNFSLTPAVKLSLKLLLDLTAAENFIQLKDYHSSSIIPNCAYRRICEDLGYPKPFLLESFTGSATQLSVDLCQYNDLELKSAWHRARKAYFPQGGR